MRALPWLLLGLVALPLAPAFAAEDTVEDYLQNRSTIPGVTSRKDPFIMATPPFEIPKEMSGTDLSRPPLERYPIDRYSIVAVLVGDQYPRALLRMPSEEKSKVVIVKEKDKLGNKGGVITKIASRGVSVVQKTRSPLGFIDKVETVLQVGEGAGSDAKKDEPAPEIRQGQPDPGARPGTK